MNFCPLDIKAIKIKPTSKQGVFHLISAVLDQMP